MSQENVEIVREAWRTFNDRGIDAALDYFAEDCVGEDFPELPDRAIYHGKEGIRERNRQFNETWGDLVREPVEFIDAGGGVVVAVTAIRGHGRHTPTRTGEVKVRGGNQRCAVVRAGCVSSQDRLTLVPCVMRGLGIWHRRATEGLAAP